MFFWDICNILNNIVLYQNPRRIWDFPFEYSILKYQVEKRGWAKSRLEHVGKQDKDALLSCIASQAGGQVLFPFLFKPVLDLLREQNRSTNEVCLLKAFLITEDSISG